MVVKHRVLHNVNPLILGMGKSLETTVLLFSFFILFAMRAKASRMEFLILGKETGNSHKLFLFKKGDEKSFRCAYKATRPSHLYISLT